MAGDDSYLWQAPALSKFCGGVKGAVHMSEWSEARFLQPSTCRAQQFIVDVPVLLGAIRCD